MSMVQLLTTLQALETELHRLETRRDPERMNMLLHPEFEEIGRSGCRYSRAEVIEEFRDGAELPAIVARDFAVSMLGEDLALLTYSTAHVSPSGVLSRFTARSSLWLRVPPSFSTKDAKGCTETLATVSSKQTSRSCSVRRWPVPLAGVSRKAHGHLRSALADTVALFPPILSLLGRLP